MSSNLPIYTHRPPQLLAATDLLFVPIDLPALDIAYKWNDIIYSLL